MFSLYFFQQLFQLLSQPVYRKTQSSVTTLLFLILWILTSEVDMMNLQVNTYLLKLSVVDLACIF